MACSHCKINVEERKYFGLKISHGRYANLIAVYCKLTMCGECVLCVSPQSSFHTLISQWHNFVISNYNIRFIWYGMDVSVMDSSFIVKGFHTSDFYIVAFDKLV